MAQASERNQRTLSSERSPGRVRERLAALLAHRYFLPLCFVVHCALRALLIALVPVDQGSDAAWYLARASAIADGLGYSENGTLTAYWPVGWPAALGFVFRLSAATPMVGQLFNLTLSCASFLLLLGIARLGFASENVARIAVALLAVYPNHVAYVQTLMSEVFFTTLLLLACWLFLIWQRQRFRRGLALLACGLSFGLLTLTKPQFVFLPSLLLAYALLSPKRERWTALVINAVVVNALMLATVAPWTYRNYQTFGSFVFVSANGGVNLLIGNNPHATGGYMSLPAARYPALRFSPEHLIETNRQANELALGWLKEQPLDALMLLPRKLWRLWAVDGEIEWDYQRGFAAYEAHAGVFRALRGLNQLYYYALLALGLVVLPYRLYRRQTPLAPEMAPGLLIAAYTTLVSLAVFGLPRFHFPVMPFVALYGAVVIADWLGARTPQK